MRGICGFRGQSFPLRIQAKLNQPADHLEAGGPGTRGWLAWVSNLSFEACVRINPGIRSGPFSFSGSSFGDLASALKMLRRPWTAPVDLFKAAEIEIADLPTARNSSNRRSSSCVQRLYLFPTMLRACFFSSRFGDATTDNGSDDWSFLMPSLNLSAIEPWCIF
jgi:hypothetical protein